MTSGADQLWVFDGKYYMVLVGLLVVLLRRGGRRVSGDRAWFRFLPTASAVVLMGLGLWMARDAWKSMSAMG